jgi:hypothetical protein
MSKLTHLDEQGQARMVDVGGKAETARSATAAGRILMSPEALAAVRDGSGPKGDVLAAARIAGIMAAKKTAELIPLCHPGRLRVREGSDPHHGASVADRQNRRRDGSDDRHGHRLADDLRYGKGAG